MTTSISTTLVRRLIILLLLGWTTAAHAVEIASRMSSRFLVRGERALLEVSIIGTRPTSLPDVPAVEEVEISQASGLPQTRLRPGRILEHVFEYEVHSYQTGIHIIPPVEIDIGGTTYKTEPLRFEVFNPDELQWQEAVAGDLKFRYASIFRVLNNRPYEGESTPTEMKIYVPRDLLVDDWGIPDFERDGLTAWRFQPSPVRGRINLLGMPYVAAAYPSTLTPTRSGPIGIGPAKIRLMTIQMIIDGFPRREIFETHLLVPRLEMESLKLPEGAPDGFHNAVGDFRMSIHTEDIEFQEGDPIPVEMRVTGSGNLDNLGPPKPTVTDGWKVYEATRDPRGAEREELSGTTVFRQFMRPLEIKGSLPPYRFVFFDPIVKQYRTLTSEPIPLLMKPAPVAAAPAGPPPKAGTPVERMSDILGIVAPASLTITPPSSPLPNWLPHMLAGFAALLLVAKAAWMRIAPRLRQNPERAPRMADLRALESISINDHRAFLMGAGRFIERWLGQQTDDETLRSIIAERDTTCFRQDEPTIGRPITSERRAEILRILHKAALTCCIVLFLVTGASGSSTSTPHTTNLADQAQTAYQEARFDEAIRLWLQAGPYDSLSPDTLYNIGNACYRSGSPGHAALYYRRALDRNPGHPESLQNLRFIERKYGSLTVDRPDYQYFLARLPLDSWKQLVATGAWMCALGFLAFPATRSGARIRIIAAVACITGPLVATTGALGWRYYPNDSHFAPIERQAVIVAQDAVLYSEASRNSTEVIDAPPGSLCEIVRLSGRWAYIAFATKTRGWVPVESIEAVIPTSPPQPPKIKKPKADGKSA